MGLHPSKAFYPITHVCSKALASGGFFCLCFRCGTWDGPPIFVAAREILAVA